jgi:hypothetical protein
MKHLISNRTAETSDKPLGEIASNVDTFLIDDEFDDFLDREIFAIRELADFRNL